MQATSYFAGFTAVPYGDPITAGQGYIRWIFLQNYGDPLQLRDVQDHRPAPGAPPRLRHSNVTYRGRANIPGCSQDEHEVRHELILGGQAPFLPAPLGAVRRCQPRWPALMSAGWLVPQLGDVLVPLPGREAAGC